MDMLVFVVTTLILGVLCSIPGVITARLLASKGVVRVQPVWQDIVGTVGGLALGRLLAPQLPLGYWVVGFLVLFPIGIYRDDLWATLFKGRWWLKEKHESS